jgi:hypothetical protein
MGKDVGHVVLHVCLSRLGVNASHIARNGGAITNACSSHLWLKASRIWKGGGGIRA